MKVLQKAEKKKKQQVISVEKEFADLTAENIKVQKNVSKLNLHFILFSFRYKMDAFCES